MRTRYIVLARHWMPKYAATPWVVVDRTTDRLVAAYVTRDEANDAADAMEVGV